MPDGTEIPVHTKWKRPFLYRGMRKPFSMSCVYICIHFSDKLLECDK
jgi:hypothetical protein